MVTPAAMTEPREPWRMAGWAGGTSPQMQALKWCMPCAGCHPYATHAWQPMLFLRKVQSSPPHAGESQPPIPSPHRHSRVGQLVVATDTDGNCHAVGGHSHRLHGIKVAKQRLAKGSLDGTAEAQVVEVGDGTAGQGASGAALQGRGAGRSLAGLAERRKQYAEGEG